MWVAKWGVNNYIAKSNIKVENKHKHKHNICDIKNFIVLLSVGDRNPCHGQKLNLFLIMGKKTTKLR